ncbi:MAG: ACT domain-containing protein [Erythrobacter sp.]|uniref:hypothetical protein n=1 Tax=Erythrobacter sp. TaxID=1042 RepID=UPI003C76C968
MTPGAVRDLKAMLVGLDPRLDERAWCFQPVADDALLPDTAFALIREEDGACAITPASSAEDDAPRFARITLGVQSDLEGVGLTGTVASVLAKSGIACNVVAGLQHDHLFVPHASANEALELLRQISLDARE